jgi:hypothetical protein
VNVVTWAEFSAAAPDLAASGRELLYRRGDGEAMLATVRGDEPPRVHPINVGISGNGLYAFLLRSVKRQDLAQDGRFALHAHQDPAAPSEFLVRGRARRVDDPETVSSVAADWYFAVDETYHLYEFFIESALLGTRTADEWPPRYTTWAAPSDGTQPAR